jgi:hypothetical protein
MKTIRVLLAFIFLVAGMLVGARLEQGRAFAGEPNRVSPLSVTSGATLAHPREIFRSRAAWVDNNPNEAVPLSNIVEVLEPQANENQSAAVGAATRLLLMLEDEQVFVPMLLR